MNDESVASLLAWVTIIFGGYKLWGFWWKWSNDEQSRRLTIEVQLEEILKLSNYDLYRFVGEMEKSMGCVFPEKWYVPRLNVHIILNDSEQKTANTIVINETDSCAAICAKVTRFVLKKEHQQKLSH